MFVNIFCLWQTYNFNDSETHIFEAKAHNPRTNDNAVEQLEKQTIPAFTGSFSHFVLGFQRIHIPV